MGRKQTGSLFTRGEQIRIQFQWQGKRVSETLDGLNATKQAHVHQAKQKLSNIVRDINNGVFNYLDYFPNSKNARESAQGGLTTFGEAMDAYLMSTDSNPKRTQAQYKNAAEEWKSYIGADTLLIDLTPQKLLKIIYKDREWSGQSRFNNALIPLRGALRLASLPDLLKTVTNKDRLDGEPDPLSPEDTKRVLKHIKGHFDQRCYAWYLFAFSTGLRPSEQCVLKHSDITMKTKKAHVTKAMELDGTVKTTKTKGKRAVDLSPMAIEAIEISKSYKNENDEVFQNPWTNKPWHGNRSQHENVWIPTLKVLGITPRRAYCTRHTYATTLLAANATVAYISSQMGHSSPTMVERTYTKWMPDSDGGRSVSILEKAFDHA